MGEDLVLTAGHCIGETTCADIVIVFDYAVKSPLDPLGTPPPPGGGFKAIPQEDLFRCSQLQAVASPFPATTSPEEAFSSPAPIAAGDYALITLDRAVTPDRIPLPIERIVETEPGNQALLLGHPRWIPLKGEVQPISTFSGTGFSGQFNALHGNSGSPVVNLHTGKVLGIATSGPMRLVESTDPSCQGSPQLYDLCFGCRTVFGQGALGFAAVVPPVGLQAGPVGELHHYGPPTSAADFPGYAVSVVAPSGGRAINWHVTQETYGPQVIEVWEGSSSGTLQPGGSTSVLLGPAEGFTHSQGIISASMPFFDTTYGTRTPMEHTVHVGVDGFAVFPSDTLDGPDGLGIVHGTQQGYGPTNRWIVPQDLTVLAYDPDDPQLGWPQWLELDGNSVLPFTLTLPCSDCRPTSTQLAVDGTNLAPGTYRGRILFSSDDSGYPPFEMEREVYFDHCREVFADATLPIEDLELLPEQAHDQPLQVSPTGGTIVADVDMIVELGGSIGPIERPFQVWLISPDQTPILLKGEFDAFQTVYDDTTSPPPAELLSGFFGASSPGTWTLRIVNKGTGSWTFDLTRYEVRLHNQGAPPCVTGS